MVLGGWVVSHERGALWGYALGGPRGWAFSCQQGTHEGLCLGPMVVLGGGGAFSYERGAPVGLGPAPYGGPRG